MSRKLCCRASRDSKAEDGCPQGPWSVVICLAVRAPRATQVARCKINICPNSLTMAGISNQEMSQQQKAPREPHDTRYDAHRVEEKWFERWESDPSLYAAEATSTKPKYYVLEML